MKNKGRSKTTLNCGPESWPECSGDPACCPENSGYGCGKPNPEQPAGKGLDENRLAQVVRLEYEGQPWTAERLKTSSYVHFKSAANPNDGMTWAVPDERMSNLARRIYHADYTPTREELFGMLSVIDSYRSLLAKPAKRQRTIARVLLQFILPKP
jgi:hypothetical protein